MSDKSELYFDAQLAGPLFEELVKSGGEIGLIWGEGVGSLSLGEQVISARELIGGLPTLFEVGIDAELTIEAAVLSYLLLGIREGARTLRVGVEGEKILFTISQ